MVKFLYYRQMASHLQVLMRSLMRKQTFEVSLLPSNGISSPSADEKFDEETNLGSFFIYHQMVSHLEVLMRSLMRKQTFEVSLLPSNGILPPSAGKKFDEETNLWKFSLYLRCCPNTTKTSFEIWTSETRGNCLPFSKY